MSDVAGTNDSERAVLDKLPAPIRWTTGTARTADNGGFVSVGDYLELRQYAAERIAALEAENAALKQTVHDEIAENLRLREVGGALPDEDMPTFLERVFSENAALRRVALDLRMIVDHWDEFGPEHGLDEAMEQGRRSLSAMKGEQP